MIKVYKRKSAFVSELPERIGGGGGIYILNFYNIIDKFEKDLIILVMYFLKRIFKVFFLKKMLLLLERNTKPQFIL